jgi:hypothetical protein
MLCVALLLLPLEKVMGEFGRVRVCCIDEIRSLLICLSVAVTAFLTLFDDLLVFLRMASYLVMVDRALEVTLCCEVGLAALKFRDDEVLVVLLLELLV